MEVFEWRENPVWLAARVRPKELFDQSTVEPLPELTWEEEFPDCDGMGTEGRSRALNLVTGIRETYEFIFAKRYWTRGAAEAAMASEYPRFKGDAQDLARLPLEHWRQLEEQEKS